MTDPTELTVRKVSYVQPTTVVRTDDQGRPAVVICPFCHEEATVESDGRITCPTGEAMDALHTMLREAVERMEQP